MSGVGSQHVAEIREATLKLSPQAALYYEY